MAKKKFLDLDGAKALKNGLTGTVGKLTTGLLLPFDGIETLAGASVSAGNSAPADARIVWVPDDGEFRASTGGGRELVALSEDEQPEFEVESIAEFETPTLPWPSIELTPTAQSMSTGLMAGRSLMREQWIEVKATKVIRRDTGEEVDAEALGLRIYGAWEDLREKGFSALWFYPFFTTREVTYEEFSKVGDWHAWFSTNFAATTEFTIPAGARVRQISRLGTVGRVMYRTFACDAPYKAITADETAYRLVDRNTGIVYRYDASSEDLVEAGQIGVGPSELDTIHPGHEYGKRLMERWASMSDKTSFDGAKFAAPMDVRLAEEMPQRMPALDLSKCTSISRYPPRPHSDIPAVRELAWIDTSSAEAISSIGGESVVYLPALNFSKVKNAYRAFRSNIVMTTISMHGARGSDGYISTDLPELESLQEAFAMCKSLVAVPSVIAPKLTNLNGLCNGCYSLVTAPWVDADRVTNMRAVFAGCYSLANIGAWNTSKGTDFFCTFYNCRSLRIMPRWTFASAQSVNAMCQGCVSLEEAVELNTAVCTNFVNLFQGCKNLRRVESIDLSAATSTGSMFSGCAKLDYIVFAKLPMGTCTLDLSGLTAWGTTDAGKQSMEKSTEALLERAFEGEGTLTMRIPAATYARWQAAFSDLDGYMAEANVTVVKL